MDLYILINWKSPFPILGVSGALFHLYFIFDRKFCEQTVKTLIRISAASDQGLHCLPRSQKWDARQILYGLTGKTKNIIVNSNC